MRGAGAVSGANAVDTNTQTVVVTLATSSIRSWAEVGSLPQNSASWQPVFRLSPELPKGIEMRIGLLLWFGAGAMALTVLVPAGPAAAGSPVPGAPSCPMFPVDNAWNADVSSLPVHARSGAWLASMGASSKRLHPDFGPSFGEQPVPYGIPYTVVGNGHGTTVPQFDYDDESDHVPYPFTADTPIEGGQQAGGDRHALIVNRDTCTLYELYDAHWSASGATAGSGAVWDLRSNALRPSGWTSADAAGLPILPGLLRRDEVRAGAVTHAIRVTAARTDRSFVWPARHQAGAASDADLPPMGGRFRLRANFDISRFRADTQVVLRAMQRYGLIVADNGSDWFITGTAEDGWDTDMLDEIKSVPASQFEAVDASGLMISPDSGASRSTTSPTAGYWLTATDGGVFSFGTARFLGSTGNIRLNSPIVGMASTPAGDGYWLVASDGGVFSFGTARFFGSTGNIRLNSPIVGMASTPAGDGYWLVASDGGVFSFGTARFFGSTGNFRLNSPVVGMAATATGDGYWMVAADGGIFAFGGARFYGSTGNIRLVSPITSMAEAGAGDGYWMVAADGGVFAFGAAPFRGSAAGRAGAARVVGMAPSSSGGGYWLIGSDGTVSVFGDAPFLGALAGTRLASPVVGIAGRM